MKRAIVLITALLFIVSVGVVFAAEKAMHAKGEVTAIDATAKTLTVKEKKGEATFSYTDMTEVVMGKEKKSMADVKVGEKVTVTYKEVAGKKEAEKISIHK